MRRLAVAALAFTALAAAGASADFVMGPYARQAGMGGAGLAVIYDASTSQYTNPAALAYSRRNYFYNFPLPSVRSEGIGLSDARGLRGEVIHTEDSDMVEIGRKLADADAMVDFSTVAGVGYKQFGLAAEYNARARAVPDAALMAWANDPNRPADPPAGATSSITAASVISMPSIAGGVRLYPGGTGDMSVGARVRLQQLRGRESIVTFGGSGSAAVVDTKKEDTSGLAIDIGAIHRRDSDPNLTLAVVANNIIHPSFGAFDQEMMLSGGAAYTYAGQLTMAADIVNVTNAYGDGIELRAGVEVLPTSYFGVRAGLSSKRGVSVGLKLSNYNFAWAADAPLMVSQTLRF